MTRTGAEYINGLRDGRTVILNGAPIGDVTTHPAFAAGVQTVAHLYDIAADPANRDLMTYPSPRDGRPVNLCWLTPRTSEDLVARRKAIKCWADASYGSSADHPTTLPHSSRRSPDRRSSSAAIASNSPITC